MKIATTSPALAFRLFMTGAYDLAILDTGAARILYLLAPTPARA